MNQPNFIMVGAPKAGTTSIAHYLNQHPEIFISKEKEPFYFLPDILKETNKKDPMFNAIKVRAHLKPEDYYSLFKDVGKEKKLGEATVHYLYHFKEVIPRIKKELGDISIIIVLRDPSLRAFSNYKYQSRGQINSFEEALELESKRKASGYNSFWYYKEVGEYYYPVKAYMENFSDVHICFFEDLKADPKKFMKEIYSFLKVETSFVPDLRVKLNPTIAPKNLLIHKLFYYKHKLGFKIPLPSSLKKKILAKAFKKNTDKIKPNTYAELKDYFKSDIQQLEKLIHKDLTHWYE